MKQPPPLRLAIIGAGGISQAHAAGILAHPDKLLCTALCDISDEQLKQRSEQLGNNPALFHDWRTMLADYGEQIDAVIIALPHHLHGVAVLDCIAAKKHILCEKPLCTNLDEADTIVNALQGAELVFMPGHNQLFAPMVREIKQRLVSGAIGQLRWLRSQDCFVNQADFAEAWRGNRQLQGGGELIDTGYHAAYNLIYFAAAPVAQVRGTFGRYRQAIEGEDTASVQVLFENGVIGEILTSWAFARPHGTHAIHLIGDQGELFGTNNVLYYLPLGASEAERIELPPVRTFTEQLAYFADCVLAAKRPLHSVEESREVLSLILQATESAAGWEPYAAHPKRKP